MISYIMSPRGLTS